MWINPLYETDTLTQVRRLIASQSLATVVVGDPLRATHVPLLLDDSGSELELLGHVPKADPVADALAHEARALCIFHGARAYVSASWYHTTGLPTYDFSVAHLEGPSAILSDAALRNHLMNLIELRESHKAAADDGPWHADHAAQERIEQLLPAIIGFRITVDVGQAKAKLSQNRSAVDRDDTATHLHNSSQPEEQEVAGQIRGAGPVIRRGVDH